MLQPALQLPSDRALGAADRAVQQQHTAFAAVLQCGGFEDVDQVHQRLGQAEDRVLATVIGVVEEFVPREILF